MRTKGDQFWVTWEGEIATYRINHAYVLYITHITLVLTDKNEIAAHSLSPAVPVRKFLSHQMTPTQRLFITRLARDGFHARRKTGGGAHPSSSDLTENDGTFSDRSSAGATQNLKGTEDLLWTIATMGESVSGRATVTVHITATSSRSGVGRH